MIDVRKTYDGVSALAAVAALLIAGSAQALSPESLREGLFGSRPTMPERGQAPLVARYVAQQGEAFILDRSQQHPLLKFEDSPEVWALRPQPAPRGDTLYVNDLGEPVLRATRLGGLTVFTPGQPMGAAAALFGGASVLKLTPLGPQQLFERLSQASGRASRAARRLIPFEVDDATPTSSALIADAAMVASEAISRMAKRPDSKLLLAKVSKIRLVEGRRPSAQFSQGVLQITVVPAEGLAGRPSSDRIVAAAGSH